MKNLILISLSFFISFTAYSQTGKVFDNLSLKSKILKSERKYAIYLPADYETSERSYPILYLLHGHGDDQTGWIQFGEVNRIADKTIREGNATAMIIVMPDANTNRIGYFNDIRGDWNYEDFFFKELMPHIEKTYRTKNEKRYRAIAGLSMGGGGSFMYALHHPELFSSSCPLSAAARNYSLKEFTTRMDTRYGITNKKIIQNYFDTYNPHQLIQNLELKKLKSVKWYIDCGDDDFLYEGNSLIHIAMRKKGIPHEFRIRDGAHNWSYWRASLPNVLQFISNTFHQH